MPDISLTEFVDFVIKAGSPKLTQVRTIKYKPAYDPAFDFWKQLREALQDYHKSGKSKKSDLDKLAEVVTDSKRLKRYVQSIAGYKKFLGTNAFNWFSPPAELWSHSGLTVRVNPELGLVIGRVPHILKLYFKEEAPSKYRLETILELMRIALLNNTPTGAVVGVLDVSKGKLTAPNSASPNLQALLQGEAASFVHIWNSI